jgi:hypothetical protein
MRSDVELILHRANQLKEDGMKRYGISVLMLAVALMTSVAFSQIAQQTIKADVPFAFNVGDKVIPAGQCFVRTAGANSSALWIENQDAKESTYVVPNPTRSLEPSDRTMLVFHKYGDRYFLARVVKDGSEAGYELRETKVEKELRAQNKIAGEEIRLAAK